MTTFKKGDKVSLLDDDVAGYILKITKDGVTIMTSEGFEMLCQEGSLVKIPDSQESNLMASFNTSKVIEEKETTSPKRLTRKKPKDRFEPTMEIDLHVHHLTKSTKGMSKHDILNLQIDTARRQLDFAISKRIQKVVFIHGVGEGVLKLELQYLLDRYNNIKHYDANFQKYGLGATEVYIYQSVKPN